MDKRFPFDSPRDQQQPRNPPTVGNMTALEIEEALFFHRRQEMQRDLQLRQLLLQEQIDSQQALRQHRMFELQQHIAGRQALASRHNEELFLQDQLCRLELQRQLQQHPHLALSAAGLASPSRPTPTVTAEAMVADSLAANAARRPSGNRKRFIDRTDDDIDIPAVKRHAIRKDLVSKSKKDKDGDELMDDADFSSNGKPRAKGKSTNANKKKSATDKTSPPPDETMDLILGDHDDHTREIAEALASVEANGQPPSEDDILILKGTIEDLVAAADGEEQVDEAVTFLVGLQNIDWPESEWESSDNEDNEERIEIILPRFKSRLPRLPVEPEYDTNPQKDIDDEEKKDDKEESLSTEATPKTGTPFAATEYPYPVDTWWPSINTIKREHRMHGEKSDDEDFVEEPGLFSDDSPFRACQRAIQGRLANEVEPGVLEKVPHCRIHRMKTRLLKGATIPDHAFCWQVTESYCTEIMVCCSICSTWRHAGCGGHYQAFSVRKNIETDTPIVPICDRCHAENVLLEEFPEGRARLERQRIEQLRRGLSTSAVIRQASFVKHGGTYKWPLGSVSATHIGGHTRSVHSRHDKAEKQWTELANRLGRGYSYRPKERIKVRTREFERLLVCVEDAEGITDRHNMMQFLQHDSRKENPAGFEKHLRNLFDPDDDEHVENGENHLVSAPSPTQDEEEMEGHRGLVGRRPPAHADHFMDDADYEAEEICARRGCCKKPRFDSAFCSDSCGVAALEYDLFRSLQVAEEMHPSLMRT